MQGNGRPGSFFRSEGLGYSLPLFNWGLVRVTAVEEREHDLTSFRWPKWLMCHISELAWSLIFYSGTAEAAQFTASLFPFNCWVRPRRRLQLVSSTAVTKRSSSSSWIWATMISDLRTWHKNSCLLEERSRENKTPMTENKERKKSNRNLVDYHFFGNNLTHTSLSVGPVSTSLLATPRSSF